MSIIEKAISALGKGKSQDEQKDSSPYTEETTGEGAPGENTVQRAKESVAPLDSSGEPGVTTEQSAIPVPTGRSGAVNIPFQQLRARGILTPMTPRSSVAEQFRTIKRPLLVNITGDSVTSPVSNGNLIMVTSALEGDGKTFSAICLALSIAMEQDKHVLFVDGDTAKAEAGRLLGVPNASAGLIDLIETSGARAEDYILDTNMDKLRILPSGSMHAHANELLASERTQELVLELAQEDPSRVIVFDSPPLLMTSEAAILASFMGQIVFIVSADQTPQHAVTQAIEHIGEDKMVGLVLNRVRRGRNPYMYNYGSDYGSYGYASRARESSELEQEQ